MTNDFPQADWRRFRAIREEAVERYCAAVLGEVTKAAARPGLSSHDRYLTIYELIENHNKHMAAMFDNPSRSTALMQLVLMCRNGLVSTDERTQFSEETQSRVQSLL